MGIDIVSYRMRIGCHSHSHRHRSRNPKRTAVDVRSALLVLILLSILALYVSSCDTVPHRDFSPVNEVNGQPTIPLNITSNYFLRHSANVTLTSVHDYRSSCSNILLCGDVHQCPGPPRTPKFPCTECGRGVIKTSKAIACDSCDLWTHVKCSDFPLDKYNELVVSNDDFMFTCRKCLLASLPNAVHDDPDSSNIDGDPNDNNLNNSDMFKTFQSKGIHVLHMNARSMMNKMDEIRLLAINTSATVIGITETWLDDSVVDSEVSIPNFSLVQKDRNRNGGGVAIFINNCIAFNVREDLMQDDLECMWAEILLP